MLYTVGPIMACSATACRLNVQLILAPNTSTCGVLDEFIMISG